MREIMLETGWDDSFKLVEVIEVTGPVERVVCLIGTWPPANKVVRLEIYRNDELVHEETSGFAATLPMAELINDIEEELRSDAQAKGARFTIFQVPAPFGRKQFEDMVAARAASGE